MHAVIAHHYWDRPGGGELVMASMALGMERLYKKPILTSLAEFKPEAYREWFGIDITHYPRVTLNIKLRSFGLYMRLFIWYPVKIAIKKHDVDTVIIDSPTYKPLINDLKKRNIHLIEYIHFPLDVSFRRKFRSLGYFYTDDPYMSERYGRFPLNIYIWLYTKLFGIFARENPFQVADLVMTNSRWTASIVKKAFGEEPVVLNPPLPPNLPLSQGSVSFEEREPFIIMVGRYAEEKRYHWVIEDVLPKLKREMQNIKLIIMGSTGTQTSESYYNYLVKLGQKHNLKVGTEIKQNADVILLKNVPRQEMIHILDISKLFLHATINEHWGIAVAEAMARGLPVVVHKSGGAWSDLALEGQSGLGYENADEAVENIMRLISDGKLWSHYSSKSLERVREITFENFVNKLIGLIKERL